MIRKLSDKNKGGIIIREQSKSHWEKKYGVLLLTIVLAIMALGTYGLTKSEYERGKADELTKAKIVAKTAALTASQELNRARTMTAELRLITVQSNGKINNFKAIAKQLVARQKYAVSLQLLPQKGDVERFFYPENSHRAAKTMRAKSGQLARRHAAKHDEMVIQGPVDLSDGSRGFIFYRPIFLKQQGRKVLWGYAACEIKISEILKITTASLKIAHVDYKLTKNLAPGSQERAVVLASKKQPENPQSYSFEISQGGSHWRFDLAPTGGWTYKRKTRRFLAYALLVDLLLLILTMVAIRRLGILFDLRRAARYDALTQIYNRRGFEEAMEKEQRRRPKQPFALAILDVDDFKFFNDYYGHQTGDAVLKQLAQSLKEAAGESGLVCRSGGDEFLLALLGQTAPEAERVFKKIVDAPHELDHNGHHIVYSLSLGYADYPDQGESLKTLSSHADEALYDVKLNGKKGMQRYYGQGKQILRSQLAFNLHDGVAHMPTALLLIQPEKAGRILFANQQALDLLGYKNLWNFYDTINKHVSHVVAPEDLKRVRAWLKDFIKEENLGQVRQLRYHVITKDGARVLVMASFSLVKNSHYGLLIYQTMTTIG